MKNQIIGKYYENTDAHQLYRFFKKLMAMWGTHTKLSREGNTVRITLHPSYQKIYSVISLGRELAETNRLRLGFALNINIAQGVKGPTSIKIAVHPSPHSWVWDVLTPDLAGVDTYTYPISQVVGYYENEVEVDPKRQKILDRLK